MSTYYEILEIEPTASEREITKSFRRLALRWHPDKNPDNVEEAEKQFKLIGEAYDVLRNEETRKEYDAYLSAQNNAAKSSHRQRSNDSTMEEEEETSHDEEEIPRWERRETSRADVEILLKLATTLLEAYLKEQERRRTLGKQLVSAVKKAHYDNLPQLIEDGAFLDELSEEGFACIHYAVQRKDFDLLTDTLACGANINKQDHVGDTVLHYAVKQNNYKLCRLLVLSYNAQTHHQNNRNKDTPLHYAIENRCDPKIQSLLIKYSSSYTWFFSQYSALDCQDLLKDTPLHLAIKTKQFETASLLINKGVRCDLKNQDGNTATDLMRQNYYRLPTNISAWLDRRLEIERRQRNKAACFVM